MFSFCSQGRVAMEWVIDRLKAEAQEFSSSFSKDVQELSQEISVEAMKLSCEAKKLSEEAKKHLDSVLTIPSQSTRSNGTL